MTHRAAGSARRALRGGAANTSAAVVQVAARVIQRSSVLRSPHASTAARSPSLTLSHRLGHGRVASSAAPPRREADHALAVTDDTWERMRSVNVDAGFHLGREVSRALIAAKAPGSMLYLTSLHAETPRNLPHYSTSKAALAMLVKEFAKTLGRYNIRVNALVPGAIAAGGFVADPTLARHIPLGRLGKSDDLAPLALAVLSNRISGYVTGAAIVIDGGISLTNWFDPPVLED